MQLRQRLADGMTVAGVRHINMPARQPRLQQCRALVELMQCPTAAIANGIGHRQLCALQTIEQLDKKRQLGRGAALNQSQNIFAPLGGDEEIAVLRAADDATVIDQSAEIEATEKVRQLLALNRGEYRHVRALPFEDLP